MVITEWNTEDCIAVRCEEAREDGIEIGHKEGHKEGRKEERIERDKYFLELLDQGLSVEEIKQRLKQEVE